MSDTGYYDTLYRKMIQNPNADGWAWIEERTNKVEQYIVGESVLDMGCGLSLLQNRTKIAYTGIDCSRVAIDWNKMMSRSLRTTGFMIGDLVVVNGLGLYDTVLLLDVLEHIPDYRLVYQKALDSARKRLIVTVPKNMPGKKHFYPTWDVDRLTDLMGIDVKSELFGGDDDMRWWMAIKDVR